MMRIIWINDLHSILLSFISWLTIENIGMQPGPEEADVMPTIKREKPSNEQYSKMPRLCPSAGISTQNFIQTYLPVNIHLLSSIYSFMPRIFFKCKFVPWILPIVNWFFSVSEKSWGYVRTVAWIFHEVPEKLSLPYLFSRTACRERFRKRHLLCFWFTLWRKLILWHWAKALSPSLGIKLQISKAGKRVRCAMFTFKLLVSDTH